MKTEITDTINEYFAKYELGDVLQTLSNASFDHQKSILRLGMENEDDVNRAASATTTITDLMALLGALHEYSKGN